jgi:hypothetical protein
VSALASNLVIEVSIAFLLYRVFIDFSFFRGGFLFTSKPGKFYGGFQAQSKCTINRKAYDISQRMPPVLQVMLLPRCRLWEELFQNNGPDLNDVALYFFPDDNIERYVLASSF